MELKPCPFCGAVSELDIAWSDEPYFHLVGCKSCCTQGPSALHEEEAIAAWDQRADTAQIEALTARIAELEGIASPTFKKGERVTKKSGSSWTGRVVGFYSTTLNPDGICVESENEPGSVQVYPAKALLAAKDNGHA